MGEDEGKPKHRTAPKILIAPFFSYLAVEERLECRVYEAVALQQLLVLLVCLLVRSLPRYAAARKNRSSSRRARS